MVRILVDMGERLLWMATPNDYLFLSIIVSAHLQTVSASVTLCTFQIHV